MAKFEIFSMGALFIYAVGAYEMGPLLGYKNRMIFLAIAVITLCLVFAAVEPGSFVSSGIPPFAQYIVASGLIVWIGSIPLLLKYPSNTSWHKSVVFNTVLGLLMLVPFVIGLLILRANEYGADQKAGGFLVLCVMALVWCADSGAYFAGRFFGKRKMLPNVSPKKTIEGLVGGIITALIGMFIFIRLGWFGMYAINQFALYAACVLTIIFSVIGDLVESMLKRLSDIKDSGKIFPGHGGMLDRVDSQLAAIPVFLTSLYIFSGALF